MSDVSFAADVCCRSLLCCAVLCRAVQAVTALVAAQPGLLELSPNTLRYELRAQILIQRHKVIMSWPACR